MWNTLAFHKVSEAYLTRWTHLGLVQNLFKGFSALLNRVSVRSGPRRSASKREVSKNPGHKSSGMRRGTGVAGLRLVLTTSLLFRERFWRPPPSPPRKPVVSNYGLLEMNHGGLWPFKGTLAYHLAAVKELSIMGYFGGV